MAESPLTRYASTPDGVSIAYQVTGTGALDFVVSSALSFPIDLLWEDPGFVRFAKRLGHFTRTIWCEYRGMGASGGNFQDGLAEETADADLTAVLDAASCERVVLLGMSGGGAFAIRYAATHPDRVRALVLLNTYAHYVQEDDYPWGLDADTLDRLAAPAKDRWGTGSGLRLMAPSKERDERFRAWWARCQRLGVGPEQGAASLRAGVLRDVRGLLPAINVPTLVLHREGNRYVQVGAGRYLAEHIQGAKYVELPGGDHWFFTGDVDGLLDAIEEFLTGSHEAPEGDVVSVTILFTDIVSSTEQSARLGHRKWSAVADDHDAMVRAILDSHHGREVKTMGDGFLVTFDATTRAVRAAMEIVAAAKGLDLEVRAGVHTGEIEVRPHDVIGLAVSIAKRICDLAGPGQVLVSEAVKLHLVGLDIAMSDQGVYVLKGVPDEWRLFAVNG
jgi:class 3 adenylate cyclase/pimeloyl-ACP methyl ester carboxylesterase